MTQRYPTPPPAGSYVRKYEPVFTYNGGVFGDETVAETNVVIDDRGVGDYAPRNLAEYIALPGSGAVATDPDYVPVSDITQPRGWIAPNQPITPKPVSPTDDPTITSLAPNTAVSNTSPIWVTITGTKFTQWSQVETGGVITPYSRYVSPTKMYVLMDPRSSAGVVVVKVLDHGVKSAGSNFTFT